MPNLSRLVAGRRDPTRVNIFLDGKFSFTLSAEEVIKHKLKPGIEISSDLAQELEFLGSQEKVFGKIINYLSYRPRSRYELEQRLRKYLSSLDNPRPVIDSILLRLKSLGYLDDLVFANWFVESRITSRPRSARHLRSELMTKGVPQNIIKQVVANLGDDEQAIRALIVKKASTPHDKLVAYLARRGFSYDLIRRAIDENPSKR